MILRNRIRNWLGLDQDTNQILSLRSSIYSLRTDISHLRNDTNAYFNGVARLLTKLDPTYGQSVFDPTRKAASDKLAEQVITKLKAEDLARRHTLGEL